MTVTPVVVIAGIQLVLTILTIIISNIRSEARVEAKLETFSKSLESINKLLGNGETDGVFIRKDVYEGEHERIHEKVDTHSAHVDRKLEELTLEINLLKRYLIERK